MEEIITYLLKSSGLIVAFYLAYYFLLQKETFFSSNRWFLLFGLVTAALLPLFFIKKIVFVNSPKFVADDVMTVSNNAASNFSQISPEVTTIDWFELLVFGYLLIVCYLLIKVCISLFSVAKIIQKKKTIKDENFIFIDLKENIAPFSFFHYIVYNSSLYSEFELQSILLHEKIHSAQKHSLDVLVTQVFTVIFWFNPFMYIYKKAVIQNLEYIADSQALAKIKNKKAYQMALLKVVSHQNCLPITNQFYQSLIKKRIVMLNKNQSNKRNIWKYSLVIPVLIAFVYLFQIKVVAQEKNQSVAQVIAVSYVLDKNSTDAEIQEDIKMLKEQQGIKYKVSKLKRNSKGEIIAIKIEFEDKKANIGTTIQDNNKPITPIHFTANIDANGKDEIGFYEFKPSKTENTFLAAVINKNESDSEINRKLEIFKSEGINFKKVKTKRNTDKEIISIQISGKGNGDNYKFHLNKSEAIDEIYMIKEYGKANKLAISERKDLKSSFAKNKTVIVEEIEIEDANDIEQAKRDAEQAKLDIEQSKRDIEQSKLDVEQAKRDIEQAKLDVEQAKRDLEQSKIDLKQSKIDIEQAKKLSNEQRKLDLENRKTLLEQRKKEIEQFKR
jgi:beta-lactamase regulating signal transducer with metallopeptidase domain